MRIHILYEGRHTPTIWYFAAYSQYHKTHRELYLENFHSRTEKINFQ